MWGVYFKCVSSCAGFNFPSVVVDSSECRGDELISVYCCGDVSGENCRVAHETNPRPHHASNVANTVGNVLYMLQQAFLTSSSQIASKALVFLFRTKTRGEGGIQCCLKSDVSSVLAESHGR